MDSMFLQVYVFCWGDSFSIKYHVDQFCVTIPLQVLYLSGKVPPSIPFLVELTCKVGYPSVKCAVKTPTPEMAPLFFEAIESLLK